MKRKPEYLGYRCSAISIATIWKDLRLFWGNFLPLVETEQLLRSTSWRPRKSQA